MNKFIIFAAGALVGSAVTWKFVEAKYKKIADEEIASVKEVFSRRGEKTETEPEKTEPVDDEPEPVEEPKPPRVRAQENYAQMVAGFGYKDDNVVEEDPVMPYVISPDEFGDFEEYDQVSLTYFANGVVTNDYGEVIDNVDELLGDGALESFGQYEEDSVFVRNEALKTDFEILADVREYSDDI